MAFDSTNKIIVCNVDSAGYSDDGVQTQARGAFRSYFEHFYPDLMRLVGREEIHLFQIPVDDLNDVTVSHDHVYMTTQYLKYYIKVLYSQVDQVLLNALQNSPKSAFLTKMTRKVSELMQKADIPQTEDVTHTVLGQAPVEEDIAQLKTSPATAPVLQGTLPYDKRALEAGFCSSSYHNLLATYQTSPAQMLLARIQANWKWSSNELGDASRFYANFMAVIQGSGSGKSRLVNACAQQEYVIYLCLRPSDSTGFPPPSRIANTFLNLPIAPNTRAENQEQFSKFFAAVFRAVAAVAKKQLSPMSPPDFWNCTADVRGNLLANEIALSLKGGPHLLNLPAAIKAASVALTNNSNARFVIVLDEARQMLRGTDDNAFFIEWRRWLADLALELQQHLFFLLLDTSSTVSNFYTTSTIDDPSARINEGKKILFRPFYELPFLGPWPLPLDLQKTLRSGAVRAMVSQRHQWPTLPSVNPLEHLFRFSRPMYLYSRSPVATPTITQHMNTVISFAQLKVFGSATTDGYSRRRLQILICYRYGIRPLLPSLQETLLAGHGASLTHIHDDHKSVEVSYLPEPIVGEMLCIARQRESDQQWTRLEEVVTAIEQEIHQRTLIRGMSKGDRGELAATVYLLHAYEVATRAKIPSDAEYHTYSGLLSIADWVGTLAGQPLRLSESSNVSITSLLADSEGSLMPVLASWISFTGWSVASEVIGPEGLAHAMCQRVGRICDVNEPAVDLVLPMVIYRQVSAACDPIDEPDRREGPTTEAGSKTPTVAAATESSDQDPVDEPRHHKRRKIETLSKSASVAAAAAESSVMMTEPITPEWEEAKARLFLPKEHECLGAVVIQVKNYANDVYLGTAFRVCQEQVERLHVTAQVPQETMLSVLVMTGLGRVRNQYLPREASVMLFVARPETPGTCTLSCQWVGLIVNGFSASVVGDAALGKLQRLVGIDSLRSASLFAECGDEGLTDMHDMVRRQMAHRLSHQFREGWSEPLDPDVDPDEPSRTSRGSVGAPSVFEGWNQHEVVATVKKQRYLLTVFCPAAVSK